jgi:hypothetical protein
MQELQLGPFTWKYTPSESYPWERHFIGQVRGPKSGLAFYQPHTDGPLQPNDYRKIAEFMDGLDKSEVPK